MKALLLSLPFSYFQRTRMRDLQSFVFHAYSEWLLSILLLLYFGFSPNDSILKFLLGYFAFISIYELGYISNDVYSVRFEQNPRDRLEGFRPNNLVLFLWVVIRVAIFIWISIYLDSLFELRWLAFYTLIIVFFFLHNYLKNKEYKIMTFINLAILRFLAPTFYFLNDRQIMLILPCVLVCYVFYRTLTYMDSKKLLNMPSRGNPAFKVGFYLLVFGVSALMSVLFNSFFPILFNIYFLIFWSFIYLKMASISRIT